jgi:hypothetical protein
MASVYFRPQRLAGDAGHTLISYPIWQALSFTLEKCHSEASATGVHPGKRNGYRAVTGQAASTTGVTATLLLMLQAPLRSLPAVGPDHLRSQTPVDVAGAVRRPIRYLRCDVTRCQLRHGHRSGRGETFSPQLLG